MQQWLAEYAVETPSGVKTLTETYYLPSPADVRDEISRKGGYTLAIRARARWPLERWLARSSWRQVQLLRGIQFRSAVSSPDVALWKLIQAERSPRVQNILSPAREVLSRGLGVIDALRALNIFDSGTMAILAAAERSNKLAEGIPQAIQNISASRRNRRALIGTMSWIGFDIFTIVQGMFWGKDKVIGWFKNNPPADPDGLERYTRIVSNLETLWTALTWIAVGMAGFMLWTIFSFWNNRGKSDWPTARLVRRIPLIGGYMRDIGFADSASAAAQMLRGRVPVAEALAQAANATMLPEVSRYWTAARDDLARGVGLGAALDRAPLTQAERMELAGASDLSQVGTVLESIAEMRRLEARSKNSLIIWLAFGLSGIYLLVAFGSAIYALTLMNMSLDSVMGRFMPGEG